jgi:rod shape-determining protein MreB
MVVDIGGGTTEVAVISAGRVVVSRSLRVAGDELDQDIINYIRNKYNLFIGERMAEQVKMQIGCAERLESELTMEVRGRDLMDGLPRTVRLHSAEIRDALFEPLTAISDKIRQVLEQTPPELAADIMERGMILAGGGALLRHLDRFFSKRTNVPARVVDDPLSCTALGAGRYLASLRKQDGPWEPHARTITGG